MPYKALLSFRVDACVQTFKIKIIFFIFLSGWAVGGEVDRAARVAAGGPGGVPGGGGGAHVAVRRAEV